MPGQGQVVICFPQRLRFHPREIGCCCWVGKGSILLLLLSVSLRLFLCVRSYCTVIAARDGEKERDRNLFLSHGCSFSPFPLLSFPGRNHQIDSSMPSSPLTLSSLFHLPSIGDSPIPQCSSGFKEIFCIKRRFYTATFLSCF